MNAFTEADVDRVARAEYDHCRRGNRAVIRSFDQLDLFAQENWKRAARVALVAYHVDPLADTRHGEGQ